MTPLTDPVTPAQEHPSEPLRYFLTYRGVTLPLALAEELAPQALRNRNTYFRAAYSTTGQPQWIEKLVYGEVELRHDYRWSDAGELIGAVISTPDDDAQWVQIGPDGRVQA